MKLAIIGASKGQQKICEKAKEMNIYTIGFAWEEGAVCKDLFSKFYPISIAEVDKIVDICKKENIDGVVSNGSDYTAEIVNYISEKLNLIGNNYKCYIKNKDKYYIRSITSSINGLSQIRYSLVRSKEDIFFPSVIKPCIGSSKKGVFFLKEKSDVDVAIDYAKKINNDILIEEYISGKEVSVESLSYNGKHKVIQITDKENSGAPHFVELAHHQPANISDELKQKINCIVPAILSAVDYQNGASHIELKIDSNNNIYLIEINLRGGGDEISNQLIYLSTGFDYIKAIIEISLGIFKFPSEVKSIKRSGIYFLCKQTKDKFEKLRLDNLNIVDGNVQNVKLTESTTNYNRDGYFVYCE